MIIDRYLFKETIVTWLSVLLVLLLIFCSKHFVRYMSYAAAGDLPTSMILQLLSLFTLSYLVLIVPFAFYMAIIITLGRLYKENEITAAEACGIGIPRITKSIFFVSLLLTTLVGVLSIWIAPWAEYTQYEIRHKAEAESELSFIAPGRFHEIRGGQGVFYIEDLSKDKSRMVNLFVQIDDKDKTNVFTSKSGFLKHDPKSRDYFLVMENGFRFEYFKTGGFRQFQYKESGIRIYEENTDRQIDEVIATSTWDLLFRHDVKSIAEVQWRISMPLSCMILSLIAVLLSRTEPRQGRYGKLFLSLLVYIAYVYSLMVSKSWISNGTISPLIGMWWAHLLAVMYIIRLAKQQFGKAWILHQLGLKRQEL